jgi:uncharacterized glyoxalase superfamily metalloenzyme YdcJ
MLSMNTGFAQDADQHNIQQAGDPQRWYQEQPTSEDYYKTLKKEAGAAYDEAVIACKRGAGANRAACMQEAHKTLAQDLIDAKAKSQHVQ